MKKLEIFWSTCRKRMNVNRCVFVSIRIPGRTWKVSFSFIAVGFNFVSLKKDESERGEKEGHARVTFTCLAVFRRNTLAVNTSDT